MFANTVAPLYNEVQITQKNFRYTYNFITKIWIYLLLFFSHKSRDFFPHRGPNQWRGGFAFKTGRREVPGSIPGRAWRPSRSEFSGVFSETRVNTG